MVIRAYDVVNYSVVVRREVDSIPVVRYDVVRYDVVAGRPEGDSKEIVRAYDVVSYGVIVGRGEGDPIVIV